MKDFATPTSAKIYGLREEEYTRFNEKNHAIFRSYTDPDYTYYQQGLQTNMIPLVKSGEKGYTRLDLALYSAAWTLKRRFRFAGRWDIKPSPNDFMPPEIRNKPPEEIFTSEEITKHIKRASKFLGASLVGVAKLEPGWVYKHVTLEKKGEIVENKREKIKNNRFIPKEMKNAIVIAVEMNASGIRCAPTFLQTASAGLGYSEMAFVSASVAEFIRNIGYKAYPCQNDTILSVPLAIDAGLGALGRLGLLVTKEFGPRIRIAKILTDAPVIPDGPDIKFIDRMNKFCENCKKCAEICESEAISFEKKSYDAKCKSNNPGVKKWYTDVEKCYRIWVETSGDCGKCLQVCPFSKTETELTPDQFWNE